MNLVSGLPDNQRHLSAWLRYDSFAHSAKCFTFVIFLKNLKLFESEEYYAGYFWIKHGYSVFVLTLKF